MPTLLILSLVGCLTLVTAPAWADRFVEPVAPVDAPAPRAAPHLSINELILGQTQSMLVLPAQEAAKVPFKRKERVLADMANRRMFVRGADNQVRLYRVGIGRPHAHIPLGRTRITSKRVDPSWWPTPRARRRDPTLPAMVNASSDNPLGTRAMNLSWKYYLIHGTNDPRKIGRGATWGCVSLYESEVGDVFDTLTIGTRTRIEPALSIRIGNDRALDPVLAARALRVGGIASRAPRGTALTIGTALTKGCALALTCRGPIELASLPVMHDGPVLPSTACIARQCAVGGRSTPLPQAAVSQAAAALAVLRARPHSFTSLADARQRLAAAVRSGDVAALADLAMVEARLGNLEVARQVVDEALAHGVAAAKPLAAYFAIEGIGGPRDLPAALGLVRAADAAGVPGAAAVYDLDLAYLFSPKHWGMLQGALTRAGYDAGPANNLFKEQSWAAFEAFANANGVARTVSLRTLSRLDLIEPVSETIHVQRYIRRY